MYCINIPIVLYIKCINIWEKRVREQPQIIVTVLFHPNLPPLHCQLVVRRPYCLRESLQRSSPPCSAGLIVQEETSLKEGGGRGRKELGPNLWEIHNVNLFLQQSLIERWQRGFCIGLTRVRIDCHRHYVAEWLCLPCLVYKNDGERRRRVLNNQIMPLPLDGKTKQWCVFYLSK